MQRPYVLTRIKDREHGTWEYTRFRAEANAVITRDSEDLLERLPAPTEVEYPKEEDTEPAKGGIIASDAENGTAAQGEVPRVESFSDAINAIRTGCFRPAIAFFEKLTRERPNYHIGWMRLGHAKREQAVRNPIEERDESIQLLEEAVIAFTEAAGHTDVEYQAQA